MNVKVCLAEADEGWLYRFWEMVLEIISRPWASFSHTGANTKPCMTKWRVEARDTKTQVSNLKLHTGIHRGLSDDKVGMEERRL